MGGNFSTRHPGHNPPRPGGGGPRGHVRGRLDPRFQRGSQVPGCLPACSRAKPITPDRSAHELFDLGVRHGSVVAERPQFAPPPACGPLHALAQIHQRARQIGQRPVEVGAPGCCTISSSVPRSGRRPTGRPDSRPRWGARPGGGTGQTSSWRCGWRRRSVCPRHLASEPDVERRRQNLERPQFIRQRSTPPFWMRSRACQSSASSRAAQSACRSAKPPYLSQLFQRQVGERHRLVAGTLGGGFLLKKKGRCSMKHFR